MHVAISDSKRNEPSQKCPQDWEGWEAGNFGISSPDNMNDYNLVRLTIQSHTVAYTCSCHNSLKHQFPRIHELDLHDCDDIILYY